MYCNEQYDRKENNENNENNEESFEISFQYDDTYTAAGDTAGDASFANPLKRFFIRKSIKKK